jgi:regulator of protease activity HflC (stomatin/prohibitin superfamily)
MTVLEVYWILAIVSVYCYMAMRFVSEDERWIIYRLGRPVKLAEPGMVFVWPFICNYKPVSTGAKSARITEARLSEGNCVSLGSAAIVYRITDPWAACAERDDPAADTIDVVHSAIVENFARVTVSQCLNNIHALEQAVENQANEQTRQFGVRVVAVNLTDLRLPQELLQLIMRLGDAPIAGMECTLNQISEGTESGRISEPDSADHAVEHSDYRFGLQ